MDLRYIPNDNSNVNLVMYAPMQSWKINEWRTRQVIRTLLFNREGGYLCYYWSAWDRNEKIPLNRVIFIVTTMLSIENKENKSPSNGHAICVEWEREKTLNDVMSSENSIPFIHSYGWQIVGKTKKIGNKKKIIFPYRNRACNQ